MIISLPKSRFNRDMEEGKPSTETEALRSVTVDGRYLERDNGRKPAGGELCFFGILSLDKCFLVL